MADTTARIKLALDGAGQVVNGIKQVEGGVAGLQRTMLALAGGLSLGALSRQFIDASDAVTQLQNKLKLATGSTQAAASAYAQLFDVAQRSRVNFTDLGDTYATIARNTKTLGLSQRQLLTVTEAIGNAMTISGGGAEGMNAALTQLGQGMASGVLRGEELNSVMEQTPRLAQAIADGLGITLGQLRQYGKDGKLTAEAVTKALQNQASVLAGEVKDATLTVGQAMTQLRNSAAAFSGSVDAATASSGFLAQTLSELSTRLDVTALAFRATQAEASPLASMLGDAFSVALETVSVLAVNVAYVFKQVGNEIGGMTAQAIAFLSLDFAGAANIGQMMREDAVKARAEVDATTARILNTRKVAESLKGAQSYDEPRFVRAMQAIETSAGRTEPAVAKVGKAAKATVDEFTKLSEKLRGDITTGAAAAEAAQHGYNTAQADFLKMAASPEWAKLTGSQRASIAALMEQKIAQEQATDALKATALATESLAAAEDARLKTYTDSAASAARRLQDMQNEAEAAEYASRYQVSLTRAIEETTIARLREQQAVEMAKGSGMNDAVVLALQQEIDTRRQLVDAIASDDVRKAADKLRKDEAAAWEKTWDQVAQSFTDALMQGGKSVKQYLIDLFRTLVLRPIIEPIGRGFANMLGGGGGGSAGGGNPMSSIGNMLSGAKSTAAVGGQFFAGTMSSANAAGTLGANATGTGIDGLLASNGAYGTAGSTATTLGTAATALGSALVGFMAGKMISGSYSAIGKSGNTAVVVGTAIGMAVAGPIGAIVGGIIGGTVNRAFGRKAPQVTSQGISGTFSTTGANVRGYSDVVEKGGWFRSDKNYTQYSDLDNGTGRAINDSLVFITAATKSYANILGLNADAINGITQTVKIDLKGLNAEQSMAKVTEALGGFGDRLAQELLGTFQVVTTVSGNTFMRLLGRVKTTTTWIAGEYVRQGETASVALERLAMSLSTVNGTLGVLQQSLLQTSLKGADAASKLVDLFGGLEAFGAATTEYYKRFYSSSDQAGAATRQLTDAITSMGLTMPSSREAFRALVESQDLMTDSGRQTYAALIQLAPAFDEVSAATRELAEQTAQRLLATYTSSREALPVLGDLSAAIRTTAATAAEFAGPVSTIHRLLGDASSGVLTFGERLTVTTGELTPAQAAVAALRSEVFALQAAASGTVVNMAGLSAALQNVNTETFVATITGVFDLIGARFKDTLGKIADERAAVRDAAAAIIGPQVMTAQQIRAGIASSTVGMPSTAGVSSAQAALASADSLVAARKSQLDASMARLNQAASANGAQQGALQDAQARLAGTAQTISVSIGRGGFFGTGRRKYRQDANPEYASALAAVQSRTQEAAAAAQALAQAQSTAAVKSAELKAAQSAQTAAEVAAKQAQLDYITSLQKFSLDSSRAVAQLGRLREETVKYYESQQQLANLMSGAASSLRGTVAAFRFDRLDPAQQLASLQERYNVAYSLALSTTGEALAGYGNELNSLINPLLQKAQDAGLSGSDYSNLVNTVLARAEVVATRLDEFAPQDYQAESLGLLGQIDSTLAALEKGAKTADQLIVDAVNAGRDTTRDGLRAVIAALTGKAVPAFAAGGYHSGGLRLVGENGPELEVTGPSRIYSAGQTARMLGSGGNSTEAVVQELSALRAEVSALRAERRADASAIAVNTGKSARLMDRWDGEGLSVRTAEGETLSVKATT